MAATEVSELPGIYEPEYGIWSSASEGQQTMGTTLSVRPHLYARCGMPLGRRRCSSPGHRPGNPLSRGSGWSADGDILIVRGRAQNSHFLEPCHRGEGLGPTSWIHAPILRSVGHKRLMVILVACETPAEAVNCRIATVLTQVRRVVSQLHRGLS